MPSIFWAKKQLFNLITIAWWIFKEFSTDSFMESARKWLSKWGPAVIAWDFLIAHPALIFAIVLAILVLWGYIQHRRLDITPNNQKAPLSNRTELVTAIHQVKETAGDVIMSRLSLSNLKERGVKPQQYNANQFSTAFDKYQDAQKELEQQELIAPEIFHEPINIFRTKINSFIQNPAPPERAANSDVVNVNTEENSRNLYVALNEIVSKINELS